MVVSLFVRAEVERCGGSLGTLGELPHRGQAVAGTSAGRPPPWTRRLWPTSCPRCRDVMTGLLHSVPEMRAHLLLLIF